METAAAAAADTTTSDEEAAEEVEGPADRIVANRSVIKETTAGGSARARRAWAADRARRDRDARATGRTHGILDGIEQKERKKP